MNQEKQMCYEEDEIDLRELFQTIWKYKKFIFIFSFVITLIAIVYALLKPNIYQVDSILEVGYYNNNDNSKIVLENPNILVEKLKIEYDVDGKVSKKEYPIISDINALKKTSNLVKISAIGLSKEKIKDFIDEIDNKIVSKHLKIIDEYKKNIRYSISLFQKELDSLNSILKAKQQEYEKNKQKAQQLAKTNTALGAIYLIEILKQENDIQSLKDKQFSLIQKINQKKMELLPINIKPTKVIKVIVYQNKIKPKRSLIVIVAFITSLILSIFIVFFIEFIKTTKEEEK